MLGAVLLCVNLATASQAAPSTPPPGTSSPATSSPRLQAAQLLFDAHDDEVARQAFQSLADDPTAPAADRARAA